MRGETVTVCKRTKTGTDPGGGEIWELTQETVDDVLVADGAQNNSTDSIRPDGIDVACTLHFPRTYTDSLRGAEIVVRGETYTVLGDPLAYRGGISPTRWNRKVECKRGDG